MGAKIEQRFGAPDISLHRAELHAALLLINPAEIIHLGKKLAGLDQVGSGVRLTFTDGTYADADASLGPTASIPPCSKSFLAAASRVLPDKWPTARPTAANCSAPKSTIA